MDDKKNLLMEYTTASKDISYLNCSIYISHIEAINNLDKSIPVKLFLTNSVLKIEIGVKDDEPKKLL